MVSSPRGCRESDTTEPLNNHSNITILRMFEVDHRYSRKLLSAELLCSITSDSFWLHGLYPPGSSVHGIFKARILEGLSYPTPGDLSDLGIEPTSLESPALTGGFLTTSATWEVS